MFSASLTKLKDPSLTTLGYSDIKLYSDIRKEKKEKANRVKLQQLQQLRESNNNVLSPSASTSGPIGDPNNNPSCRGDTDNLDFAGLSRNLEEEILSAKRNVLDELGDLRRTTDRTSNTPEGLEHLRNLTKQIKTLVKLALPVTKQINRKRSHVPIKKIMNPTKKTQKRTFATPPPADCHIKFTLPFIFSARADHGYWPYLISSYMDQIDKFINEKDGPMQLDLLLKLREAREYWSCSRCNSFDLFNIESGFIPCDLCHQRYHQRCVNMEVSSLIF